MLIELTALQFAKVGGLFDNQVHYVPVLAIIEGRYPGRVFVDDPEHPHLAVVWALGRWAYIQGDHGHGELQSALYHLISNCIIPDWRNMNVHWFELYAPNSADWLDTLDICLRAFGASRHFETTYTWDEDEFRQSRIGFSLPPDLTLAICELPILSEKIASAPGVAPHYRALTAVACEARVDGLPVSICKSNGFAAGGKFMIDVVTPDERLRGRGYATAAGEGLLDYCITRGLEPLWETTESNVSSQRLARRLGFVAAETYPVYAINFERM